MVGGKLNMASFCDYLLNGCSSVPEDGSAFVKTLRKNFASFTTFIHVETARSGYG